MSGVIAVSSTFLILTMIAPSAGAASFTAAAKGLVIRGGTKPGDTQTLSLKIETKGSGVRDVSWAIYRDNQVLVKSETRIGVTAGTAFDVSASWTALAGPHTFQAEVDPKNSLQETTSEQRDNRTPVSSKAFADWPRWVQSATEGSSMAVRRWMSSAVLVDVRIDGAIAWEGKVQGSYSDTLVSDAMIRAGAPPDVARGFALAVGEPWERWQASVRVPGLQWYPAFAAYSGTTAPPTPNLATPLASLTQSTGDLSAAAIAAGIKTRIGPTEEWPEGSQQIVKFSEWFNSKFTAMLAGGTVTNVMGSGRVPAYAPPRVMSGPVKGTGTMMAGGFQCSW